jgi:AraC-like DNA-binding protein
MDMHEESRRLGDVPHASGVLARLACARAREARIELPPLLRRAHVSPEQIADSRIRLPVSRQIRLVNLIAGELGDELLGFHLGRQVDLRELGLLYYVLASSETVLESIRRAVRYSVLANEGVLQQCSVGRQLVISLHYVGVGRHLDRHQPEFLMTLVVRMLRQLTGLRVQPLRVRLMHGRGTPAAEYASYFGQEVGFNAPYDDIAFAATVGDLPVISADPYLNRLLVRYCEEALVQRRPIRHSFRSTVENAIVPLLPHAEVRAVDIARKLGVSVRTFSRRLSEEGVSFSEVLERLRRDLAKRYLNDDDLSISQIAWLLGFSEASAFSKAYKRWNGQPPRSARPPKAPGAAGERMDAP